MVRQQLAAAPDGGRVRDPLAQLLVFDPTAFGYEGRAAIAVGDVDTADNVAFLVPGLGSDVSTAPRVSPATALRVETEAHRVAPAETTATVAWMGYDAPGPRRRGIFDDAAEDGAELLADDVLAVQASRRAGTAPHRRRRTPTAARPPASALRDHETGTDDVVLVGSPGAGRRARRATSTSRPATSSSAPAAATRSAISTGSARTRRTSRSERPVRGRGPSTGRGASSFGDHSKYFDPHSESLANIAHVVTGDYAGVVPAPYRDEVFLLPDGINSDPESDREPTTVP